MGGRWRKSLFYSLFIFILQFHFTYPTEVHAVQRKFLCAKNIRNLSLVAVTALGLLTTHTYSRLHSARIFRLNAEAADAPALSAVFLGDSLSTNFKDTHQLEIIKTFYRGVERGGAFIDTDTSTNSVYSVLERLAHDYNISAACLAKPVAMYGRSNDTLSWTFKAAGLYMIPGQITQLENFKEFPQLIVLWAGQNDLQSLLQKTNSQEKKHIEDILNSTDDLNPEKNPTKIISDLTRVVELAKKKNQKTAIVVFGLNDANSILAIMEKIKAARAENPKLYPYFEDLSEWFVGFEPKNSTNYRKLVERLHRVIPMQIERINDELKDSNVRVFYSDSISKPFPADLDLINADDGVHPSTKGKNLIAERAMEGLVPALQFLK